ncbi:MAG: zf-HC2 domain-containing protein [Planctomycetes bacterium]|nr:zf-HC2 domain-containing protein [Planctomycetota bacterium]
MTPAEHTEIKKHVASCPKCRHAKRIGALCPVGRKWLDAQFRSLAFEASAEHNRLRSVASSK